MYYFLFNFLLCFSSLKSKNVFYLTFCFAALEFELEAAAGELALTLLHYLAMFQGFGILHSAILNSVSLSLILHTHTHQCLVLFEDPEVPKVEKRLQHTCISHHMFT